mgnify:FL=1
MVKLKWGMEYKGYLVSVDGYMNMQVRAGEGEGGREEPGPCLLVGGKAARFWAALRSVWPRLLRVEAEVRLVRLLLV